MNDALKGQAIVAPVTRRMTFPDGLRGIASLLVVLPHAVGFFVVNSPSAITRVTIAASGLATTGVEIFFVLSGFVIAYTLREQRVTPRYLGVFILRRSVRLDPPYWFAIAWMVLFRLLQSVRSPSHAELPTVRALIAHLFYLQGILKIPSVNVVFWTLCIEVQLYIVFCCLVGLVQAIGSRVKVSVPAVGVCTYLGSLLWPAGLLPSTPGYFVEYWYAFIVGAIVWWTCDGRLRWRTAFLLLLPLAAAMVYGQSVNLGMTLATSLSLLLCARAGGLHRWFSYKPMLLLGRLSYCLYLVHVPIAGTLLFIYTRLRLNEVAAYMALLLTYVLSLLVAYVLHRTVEMPALRWSQQLKSLYRDPPPTINVEDDQVGTTA